MTVNTEKEKPLSKYKLLEKYSQFINNNKDTDKKNVNDDAAIIKTNNNKIVSASSLFTEHIDFNLDYFPLKHLGYKIIVVSMMDILAMNGVPSYIRINIALSNRFSEEMIDELMNGIIFCCSKYNISIVGLEFQSNATGLIISTSTTGAIDSEQEVYRNGAKENEIICVTGDLGSAYTGLILLERENKVYQADPSQQPDFIGVDYLLERYLKPEPPEIKWKSVLKPTSMTNLKEGLATGLIHICNASKLGCTIFEEKLPIDILTFDKLKELGIVATTIALNGGEDYELLFTIKQEDYDKIKEMKEVSVIGYMSSESSGKHIITNDNKQFELQAQGF